LRTCSENSHLVARNSYDERGPGLSVSPPRPPALLSLRIVIGYLIVGAFGIMTLLIPKQISARPASGRYLHLGRSYANKSEQPSERESANQAAETLFREGKQLAAEWSEASLRRATEKFISARSQWRTLKDTRNEINSLNLLAEVCITLSEYHEALRAFNSELSISHDLRDKIHSLNGLSEVYIYLGNQTKALAAAQRAYQLSRESNDAQGEAESLLNLSDVYYFQGQTEKSLENLQQVLSRWPDNSWHNRVRALLSLGYSHFDLRQMNEALSSYEEALSLSRSNQDRRGEALALTAIGGVYSYLGNREMALEHQNQAVKLFRTIGDRNGEAVACNGLGYVYRNLAEYKQSLDCYLRASELFQLLGNLEYETFTITRVGIAYEGLGDYESALKYYQLALARAATYSLTRAHALSSMGTVFVSMKKPEKALVVFDQALAIFRSIGDRLGESELLNSLGKVYASLERRSESLRTYQQALSISRAIRDRRGEISALYNLAQFQRDSGDYSAARKTVEQSLGLIESLRTEVASPTLRASYFASVRDHYELYVDILLQSNRKDSDQLAVEEALAVSEKAHARSLLELLEESRADIRQGVDALLLEQAHGLQKQLNERAEKQRQLIAAKQTDEASALAKEIDQLSAEYDQLEVRIKLTSPRFAALTLPQPLTLKEIQEQVLDDDTLLLEYMLGDERSYVWVVTRAGFSSHELPGRAEIEKTARRYYELVTAKQPLPEETPEQTRARAEEAEKEIAGATASLSELLLAPVANELGTKRLLIVADGALQYTPFQSLTVLAGAGGNDPVASTQPGEQRPLVLDHEIIYEPSASTLALVLSESVDRKPPIGSVAVIADPVFDAADTRIKSPNPDSMQAAVPAPPTREVTRALRDVGVEGGEIPRLISSREEADAIMSVVPWRTGFKAVDFDASRTTAMGANLGQYRVVHFATHALLDNEHPELSGIVLSLVDQKGQRQDGFLRLHDIYNLKLPVDLVVLSACQTGLGKDVKGEGLIGLTRGFMYAGASGVVASLWKVDDEATAELMKHFYAGLFEKGLSSAAALREAQLAMRQEKRWQEPYYWAGFVIQGQYAGNGPKGYQLTPAMKLAGLGFVALGLCLSVFFVLWQRRRRNL
jgi:CHAT domain-containing protein